MHSASSSSSGFSHPGFVIAAAKRFKKTASGGFKRSQAHHRHILTKKSTKRKRHLRTTEMTHAADAPLIRRMLPYA